jgi:hypothetical protein
VRHLDDFQEASNSFLMEELEDMETEAVKEEYIKKCLVDLAYYVCQNTILQRNNTGKELQVHSAKEYYGQIKSTIKEQTSELHFWKTDSFEVWYKELLNKFNTDYRRQQFQDNTANKDPNSRAINGRCDDDKLFFRHRHWKPLQGVDLESICKSIVNGDAASSTLYPALGRGGELQFVRW